jgi:hypothetical protein
MDTLLAASKKPPIIILQSDHGPSSLIDTENPDKSNHFERMSILNAYHFPGPNPPAVYDSISPVNTFRLIFNRYFETQYPLLPDRSYYSRWSAPYEFIDVTDRVRSKTLSKD